jgi:Arc/MetJ-type ribon-helix-helix transcriptional regulator
MIWRMRSRVTVSLPTEVLSEAERLAAAQGSPGTRSAVVEQALRLLVRKLREEELTRSLDEYYLGQTRAERDEHASLLAAFRRLRRGQDLDSPAAPKRRAKRR